MSSTGKGALPERETLLEDTADVLLAHMSRSQVVSEDLPDLIRSVHRALLDCKLGATVPAAPPIHVTRPARPTPSISPTVHQAEPAAPRRTPPLLAPVSMPVVEIGRAHV